MDYIQIIGIVAVFFITLPNVPQAYKIIKEKNTEGISVATYLILLIGNLLWLTYGIVKEDVPLIIANTITVFSCSLILTLNFVSRIALVKIHKKVLPLIF